MNQTPNYNLNQWEANDRVQRTDFNADNAKIDAALKIETDTRVQAVEALTAQVAARGNCCTWFGSYTGTGTYGKDNPITLTFPRKPLVVLIFSEPNLIAVRGISENFLISSAYKNYADWGEKSFTFYATDSARPHMNTSGRVYYYCAFLEV